jgi:hypothetical protein
MVKHEIIKVKLKNWKIEKISIFCIILSQFFDPFHFQFDYLIFKVCAEIIVYLKESILEVELIYNTHAFVDRNISC